MNYTLGFSALASILLLGYVRTFESLEGPDPGDDLTEASAYMGRVIDYPVDRGSSWRITLEVETIKKEMQWTSAAGNVLLNLSKNDTTINYGQRLLIKGHPSRPAAPRNPHEFDYRKYLSYQNILWQQFVPAQDYAIANSDAEQSLRSIAFTIRENLKEVITKYTASENQSVILALVLGVKDYLQNDLKQAYSAAGAMHILAVSGLHVGIIYGILIATLGWLRRYRHGRWLIAAATLLLLWLYAFVTGLSPSVLRAATMFSFIAIASNSGWQTNIYNTLAASAFLLLFFNPLLLMSVGFQLSYLAVFGIVYLQPKIYGWFSFRCTFANKIWALTAVSIAAQAATFPLSALYFNQFPTYFLASNLVVIPAAFGILVLGLALTAFGTLEAVARPIAWLLDLMVYINNTFVQWIEALPMSTIKPIVFTAWQTTAIYALMCAILLLLAHRKFRFMKLTFLIWLALTVSGSVASLGSIRRQQIVFYAISGHTAIDLIKGNKLTTYMDSSFNLNANKSQFHIEPHRNAIGFKGGNVDAVMRRSTGSMDIISWHNQLIIILKKPGGANLTVNADYIVVANDAIQDLKALDEIRFKKLIIDGSNKFYIAKRLKSQAEELNLPHHSLLHSGALQIEF